MWRNYLTIAIRMLTRHRVQSAINIGGLALGLAGCSSSGAAPTEPENATGAGVLTITSIPNYQNSLPAVVEAFEDENPDIDVQLEFVDVEALHTQIRTQLGDTLQGVVERVLTGEKSRFDGLDRLCAILAEAVSRERGRANPGSPG